MKSVNKVILIGNLTRDPELRYTENKKAKCIFGLATNRNWKSENGEKHEETDFYRIVAWKQLAELCKKYLFKGRLVYVEGRIQTHSWTNNEGVEKVATEIVIDDMKMLDNKKRDASDEPVTQTNNKQPATLA